MPGFACVAQHRELLSHWESLWSQSCGRRALISLFRRTVAPCICLESGSTRDPLTVADLLHLGIARRAGSRKREPFMRPLEEVIHDADALLSGEKRDDLEDIFTELARTCVLPLVILESEDGGSMTRTMLWRTE